MQIRSQEQITRLSTVVRMPQWRISDNLNSQVSMKDFSLPGYGHMHVFKHSSLQTFKQNLRCHASYGIDQTCSNAEESQLHCAVLLGIDAAFKATVRCLHKVWDATAISLQSATGHRQRDTNSHTDTENPKSETSSHRASKVIARMRDTESQTDHYSFHFPGRINEKNSG